MAYVKTELVDLAISVMAGEEIVTWGELWDSMGISPTTAFKFELQEVEDIKNELQRHKTRRKKRLRRRWADSDNAALQIAEYKLLSDDDELARLNTQKVNADVNLSHKKVIFESDESGDQGQA
jgi:hypothetical protein